MEFFDLFEFTQIIITFVSGQNRPTTMYRILIAILLTLQFSMNGEAQILNIQSSAIKKDSSTVKGSLTSSLSLYNRSAAADEPVELFGYDIKSSLAVFTANSRISFMNAFNYLKINDDPFLNTGYQHVRYHIFEKKRFHPEAFAQFQYDNFRGLFPRWLGGLGFRYELIRQDDINLFAGSGIMYEYEVWLVPNEGVKREVDFLKSTNYLGIRWDVSESFDLNMITFYQTAYDQNEQFWRNRISVELNINSTISKRFRFTNSFSLSHEDRPIVPITQTIYNFTAGLTYDL